MLLGVLAASRLRPVTTAVPLPFALGGFGAVYDPYHLASMVTSGGAAPVSAGGDQIVGIIGSHGTNEARTTGGIIGNKLVLDQAGFGGVLHPLLTVKDGVQCWDMRDTTHDRALWGSCAGMDPRTALKGCVGAMLWLDYDVQGSPLCFNRNASGAGLGLAVPWDMYDDRANYPYGMFKIATSGVTQFMVAGRNDESSYKPADGVTGGWFACILQWAFGAATNNATVRVNSWVNGVETQDATSGALKIWDSNADADNYDRFTLGGQQDAGSKARGWTSYVGRTFWTEDFLDDAEIAEMTAWLQGTAYVRPGFAAPFTPVFRMSARDDTTDTAAPDGGLDWLAPANAASAAPISAAITLGGGGDTYRDTGGSAGYGISSSVNTLRFPPGAMAEFEMYGNPITIVVSGVANGPARVNLIFREAYWTAAGVRAFDIIINGVTVESGLDPYALVGGGYCSA